MQDSNQGLWSWIYSRLNAHWQTDWAIMGHAKMLELNSLYLWSASVQPTSHHCGLSHLALVICMFVVVNFDAQAQASDFRIERWQIVKRAKDLWNQISSRPNACWQAEWAIEGQAKYLHSIARPYDQRAFNPFDPTGGWLSHLALVICILMLISMLWHRQTISNLKETECPVTNRLRYWWSSWKLEHDSPFVWAFSPLYFTVNWLSHMALAIYMSVVVSFHAHAQASDRQPIFEWKGGKLSSSAEYRYEPRVSGTESPPDWMPTDKPTELSRVKLEKVEINSPSLRSADIQHTWLHYRLSFLPGSGDVYVCCC